MENDPTALSNTVSKILLSFLSHEMMNRFNVLLTFSDNLCKSDQLHASDRLKAERLSRASHEAYQSAEEVMHWRTIFESDDTKCKDLRSLEVNQMMYDLNEKFDDVDLQSSFDESVFWCFQFVPSHLKAILEFFVNVFRKYDFKPIKRIHLGVTLQDDRCTLILHSENDVDVLALQKNRFMDAAASQKTYDSFTLGLCLTEILASANQSKIDWKETNSDFRLMIEIPLYHGR